MCFPVLRCLIAPSSHTTILFPGQMYVFIPNQIRGDEGRSIWSEFCERSALLRLRRDDDLRCLFLARSPEVSGVVYVPGNMAASFRGRPIRSLRMRGKPEKVDSLKSAITFYSKNQFFPTPDDLGGIPHHVLRVCFWQVGMTAGKRTYHWIWPEVSRGFITSPWKRLLFKMDEELFFKH